VFTLETILASLDCEYEVRGGRQPGTGDFCSLFEPTPGGITWIRANAEATHRLVRSSDVSVVLCPQAAFPKDPPPSKTFVLVDHPQLRFLRLTKRLSARCESIETGIHHTALVSPLARIGNGVSIGPFAQVGACELGDNVVIKSHAIVRDGVRLGHRVMVSEFVNIGGQGFSHIRNEHGHLENMPHIGTVVLEDDVEIFPYSNVDRGTLGTTRVGRGTKIDHYCHIGHNTTIGRDTVVTANVTLAGGVIIGNECMIGVGTQLRDGVRVGNGVVVGMSATVTKDIPDGETWVGSPAMEFGLFKQLQLRARS